MTASALFATVPHSDYLRFGHGDAFDAKMVVDLLSLKKRDVSKLAQVAESSVRYDDAIPVKVRERLEEIGNVINLVAGIFEGDAVKTTIWFKAINPMLGDVSPRDMIRFGRYDKLRKYIVSAVSEQAKEAAYARKKTGAKAP